jgi:hypothetical protein
MTSVARDPQIGVFRPARVNCSIYSSWHINRSFGFAMTDMLPSMPTVHILILL